MRLLPILLALAALPCGAQQYPAKPIRMIVPVAAGGSTDNNGRLLAEKLTQGLGQSVFVENRPGASTDIGMSMLARAAPDGYTLAAVPMPSISTGILARKLPYDPYKDIVPVAGFSRGALVFVVSGASPYQTMAELIAGAKAKPGALSFGSIGIGSTHHLAGELLKLMAGVDLLHVPYKGASESNTAVLAGQIEASVSGGSSIAALVRAGKLRALAVTEGTRVPSLPDVPSVAETVPGYAAGSGTLTLFAPGGTPPAIVARLSAEVVRAVKDPEVIKRIAAAGEYPAPSTPEELATELRTGIEKWTHLVKVTGLNRSSEDRKTRMAKIRIGIIGASLRQGWAGRSHLPALVNHPDCELVAVCTTKMESAEEAKNKFGARFAYADHREMLKNPEIDAVSVVVKVPSHYQPTLDVIAAGKHVYTEWPLGRNTAEAVDMAAKANAKGVRHMVGLQARANPSVHYLRDLVKQGYVGEMLSCRVHIIRDGILQRPSARAWQREDDQGANILTIPFGHTVDAFRFVAGEFDSVRALLSTRVKQWLETDTKKMVDVDAPDTVMVAGLLKNGAAVSAHASTVPFAGIGYQMEIYGRAGTLVVSGEESPQLRPVRIQGAKGSHELKDLPVPASYGDSGPGEPGIIARMYSNLAGAVRSGRPCEPSFDTAVEMHRLLDSIRAAAK